MQALLRLRPLIFYKARKKVNDQKLKQFIKAFTGNSSYSVPMRLEKGSTGNCFCRISGRPDIQLIQKPYTVFSAGYL
jgi:hypothetical protein